MQSKLTRGHWDNGRATYLRLRLGDRDFASLLRERGFVRPNDPIDFERLSREDIRDALAFCGKMKKLNPASNLLRDDTRSSFEDMLVDILNKQGMNFITQARFRLRTVNHVPHIPQYTVDVLSEIMFMHKYIAFDPHGEGLLSEENFVKWTLFDAQYGAVIKLVVITDEHPGVFKSMKHDVELEYFYGRRKLTPRSDYVVWHVRPRDMMTLIDGTVLAPRSVRHNTEEKLDGLLQRIEILRRQEGIGASPAPTPAPTQAQTQTLPFILPQ